MSGIVEVASRSPCKILSHGVLAGPEHASHRWVRRTDVRAWWRSLDVNLSLLADAMRGMEETHVMGKRMNDATVMWLDVLRKDQCLGLRAAFEDCQLGIKLQSLGIIHVTFCAFLVSREHQE